MSMTAEVLAVSRKLVDADRQITQARRCGSLMDVMLARRRFDAVMDELHELFADPVSVS